MTPDHATDVRSADMHADQDLEPVGELDESDDADLERDGALRGDQLGTAADDPAGRDVVIVATADGLVVDDLDDVDDDPDNDTEGDDLEAADGLETADRDVAAGYDMPPVSAERDLPPVAAQHDIPAVSARPDIPAASAQHDIPAGSAQPDVPEATARRDNGDVGPEWHDIQAMFVDDPRGSVELAAAAAGAAVDALIATLHERQSALAPAPGGADDSGETEHLREALRSYRIFCQNVANLGQQLTEPSTMAG